MRTTQCMPLVASKAHSRPPSIGQAHATSLVVKPRCRGRRGGGQSGPPPHAPLRSTVIYRQVRAEIKYCWCDHNPSPPSLPQQSVRHTKIEVTTRPCDVGYLQTLHLYTSSSAKDVTGFYLTSQLQYWAIISDNMKSI